MFLIVYKCLTSLLINQFIYLGAVIYLIELEHSLKTLNKRTHINLKQIATITYLAIVVT